MISPCIVNKKKDFGAWSLTVYVLWPFLSVVEKFSDALYNMCYYTLTNYLRSDWLLTGVLISVRFIKEVSVSRKLLD